MGLLGLFNLIQTMGKLGTILLACMLFSLSSCHSILALYSLIWCQSLSSSICKSMLPIFGLLCFDFLVAVVLYKFYMVPYSLDE